MLFVKIIDSGAFCLGFDCYFEITFLTYRYYCQQKKNNKHLSVKIKKLFRWNFVSIVVCV